MKVYLDNAATTKVDPRVCRAMEPYLCKIYGNPSSIHSFGRESRQAIDKARHQAASFLGCQDREVIFTSGATEANNLALRGVPKGVKAETGKRGHVITSQIEHHCVGCAVDVLEEIGYLVSRLPVKKDGLIDSEVVRKAIRPDTILVSIMYANNEIGTVQPIREIGRLIKKERRKRQKGKSKIPIFFHTDAVQAVDSQNCNVDWLGVDLLTLSAHKIYGPKGSGALYIRSGTPIKPIVYGGGHEFNIRSGTENVAGIVGLAKAIELVQKESAGYNKRIASLRERLEKGILKIPGSKLVGHPTARIPKTAGFVFKNVEGESIVIALDLKGIAASTGSACAARKLEASHVLVACGIPKALIHGSLRLSLGKYTTKEEIDRVLEVLPGIVKRLRKIAP